MPESVELIIGVLVLAIVISLTRKYHTWRIQRAYRLIIKELKSRNALDSGSAVKLTYSQKSVSKMGIRDHQRMALEHLVFDNIVCVADEDRYYLKDSTL